MVMWDERTPGTLQGSTYPNHPSAIIGYPIQAVHIRRNLARAVALSIWWAQRNRAAGLVRRRRHDPIG